MRPTHRSVVLIVALVATITAATGAPSAAQERAGNGSVAIVLTQEDTRSVDVTESFVPPGRLPVVGDFLGGTDDVGRLHDILWYTPGPGGDALWRTKGDRSWVQTSTSVTGTYTPIVGRFTDDDAKDDIFWYAPGPTVDYLWDFNDDGTITSTARNISGTYTPIKGRFTDDGADDIIWYAPGPAADSWWDFNADGTITNRPLAIKGTYTPVVGSFGGIGSPTFDDVEDIFWYAPGPTADSLWDLNPDGSITKVNVPISGTYTPVPGNFSGDGFTDILWYAPGRAQDHLWDFTGPNGTKTSTPRTINGTYTPFTGELFEESPHLTDVLWFGAGSRPDAIWDFTDSTLHTNRSVTLDGDLLPVLGAFEIVPYSPAGGGTSYGIGLDILDRSS